VFAAKTDDLKFLKPYSIPSRDAICFQFFRPNELNIKKNPVFAQKENISLFKGIAFFLDTPLNGCHLL
jgi:hypothetical protein